ncbi:stabilizer of axonemal microtubules 2-like isoform X2 [Cimex lectularius]|nr:stabilizer of axonemal microtubules 2-like isoform X2 [Cimex lectularius]
MRYIQPAIPISYKPLKVYRPPEIKMPDGTTYNMSYEAFDPKLIRTCRGKPSFTKENLSTSGAFSDKTTHKMSYGAWPNLKRPEIQYPKDHKLVGDGPISEMTTNRHDYTPKPLEAIRKIIQPCALGMSKSKMENATIHTMSYKNPDMSRFEPPQSYKPIKTYFPPDSPLEGETVHRLSYMPWELPPKEDMPWTKKGSYQKPCIPLDGNTIYNGSYIPPGRLEEDPLGHCIGCYCLTPIECLNSEGDPPKNTLVCPEGVDPNSDQRNTDNNDQVAKADVCPDPKCGTEAGNVEDKVLGC